MSRIVVCPLPRLAETVESCGARHLVTLINTQTLVERPNDVRAADHLVIGVNDIADEVAGLIRPAESHVSELLSFVGKWDRKAPLVIHCLAGISRSPAAAYVSLCSLRPDLDEAVVAQRLRQASPEATPNRRLIAVADTLLARDGRMIKAIAGIGRGLDAAKGSVFGLAIDA